MVVFPAAMGKCFHFIIPTSHVFVGIFDNEYYSDTAKGKGKLKKRDYSNVSKSKKVSQKGKIERLKVTRHFHQL